MSESKISVEVASTMSLDEYISASGIKAPPKPRKRNNRGAESMDCDEIIPCANSVSWRLKDVNRPVGMSPLIPANARQREYIDHYNNHRNRRNYDKPYADRDKPQNGVNRRKNMRQNVTIQTGLRNTMTSSALVRHQSNAIATMNQISESVVGMVAPLIANSSYENVFNKLMEKWEEKKNQNKQKYDMGLQKEISEIQGKTLYFTCPSGQAKTVVSSDGVGLDDCVVKPVATDTSLHQRFA